MKYGKSLETALGNLEALTTKAFRKKTLGLKDMDAQEEEAGESSAEASLEKVGAMPEGVDESSPEGMRESGEAEDGMDEESLRRILKELSNATK